MVQTAQHFGKPLLGAEGLDGALQSADVGERRHHEVTQGETLQPAGIGLGVFADGEQQPLLVRMQARLAVEPGLETGRQQGGLLFLRIQEDEQTVVVDGYLSNPMSLFTRSETSRATRNVAATSCSSTSIYPSYSARLRLRWA